MIWSDFLRRRSDPWSTLKIIHERKRTGVGNMMEPWGKNKGGKISRWMTWLKSDDCCRAPIIILSLITLTIVKDWLILRDCNSFLSNTVLHTHVYITHVLLFYLMNRNPRSSHAQHFHGWNCSSQRFSIEPE